MAQSNLTTGACVAQFIMETTKHCYIQNVEVSSGSSGFRIFFTFPHLSLWEIDAPGPW